MSNFESITTEKDVQTYEAASGVFSALLNEVRELSKKKPDSTMSTGKVKLVNNVLRDLITILSSEPEGKYLAPLEDEALPQVSDALMMMAQFDAAVRAFVSRYRVYVERPYRRRELRWITAEQVSIWDAEDAELRQRSSDLSEEDGANLF
jgi:hypothetical protein